MGDAALITRVLAGLDDAPLPDDAPPPWLPVGAAGTAIPLTRAPTIEDGGVGGLPES